MATIRYSLASQSDHAVAQGATSTVKAFPGYSCQRAREFVERMPYGVGCHPERDDQDGGIVIDSSLAEVASA
jgi:hypothetical protein